jgi:hypothetical protein
MQKALVVAICILACSRVTLADFSFFVQPTYFPVPGHSSYDLHVFGAGVIDTMLLIADIDRSSFYQHPLGSMSPPSELALGTSPELAYDTFVGWGGLTQQTTDPNFQLGFHVVRDTRITAMWGGGPSSLDQESLLVARLTVPNGSLVALQTNVNGVVDNFSFNAPVETLVQIVEGTPSQGSTISLQPTIVDGTGILEEAIVLKDVHPHGEVLPTVPIESLTFSTNDFDLFAALNNPDDSSIDLMIDLDRARTLGIKPGTVVNATLVIDPEFAEPLEYYLTATIIPEPPALWLGAAMAVLGSVWLRRR